MTRTQSRPSTGVPRTVRRTVPVALPRARWPRGAAAPVLAEVRRGPFVESRHRGHVVQVDVHGKVEQGIGDPDYVTSLRSAVKPFAIAALFEAGAVEEFHLTDAEIAIMAASHAGEDAHVRTVQGILRRAGMSQNLLACGTEPPNDPLTAARLAREGEAPGSVRHQCSGFHTASLLLSRHAGWSLNDYWRPEHPAQLAAADTVAKIFGVKRSALISAVDNCGVLTYAFPLASIATAYALLADPAGAADSSRKSLVPALTRIRDAMMAAPDMVGGTRISSDTILMKARPGKLVSKGGAEAVRGIGLLPGTRGADTPAAGLAIKIEDGDGYARANRAVSAEALAQLGVFNVETLERLGDLHRPPTLDPRGVEIATTVPGFQLAPLSELG